MGLEEKLEEIAIDTGRPVHLLLLFYLLLPGREGRAV